MSGLDHATGFSPAPSGATDTSSGATNVVEPPPKRLQLPALPAVRLEGQTSTPPRSTTSSAKKAAAAAARTAVAEARLALAEARLDEADLAEDEEQDLAGTTYAMRHTFVGENVGLNFIDADDGQMTMGLDGQWQPLGAQTAPEADALQQSFAADLEVARGRLEAQAGEQAGREQVLREEHQLQQEALSKARFDWEAAQRLIAAQQHELQQRREDIDREVQAKQQELQQRRQDIDREVQAQQHELQLKREDIDREVHARQYELQQRREDIDREVQKKAA